MATKQIHELTQQLTPSDADKIPMQVTSSLLTKYVRFDALKSYVGLGAAGYLTALTSTVAAGATSLVLDAIPSGLPTKQFYVALNIFDDSSECEVKKVTNRTGNTITISATAYDHLSTTPILIFWEPVLYGSWFYAIGDNSTNNYTAISRMLASAFAEGFAKCILAPGIYQTGNTLTIPAGVTLEGYGVRNTNLMTIIKPTSGFIDTNLVQMGELGVSAFDCQIVNIYLECSRLAENGIYSDSLDGGSGLHFVRVRNATGCGIKFDGSVTGICRAYDLDHIQVGYNMTVSGTETGIYLDGGGKAQIGIRYGGTTTFGGVGQVANGILLLDYIGGECRNLHFENCIDGIHAGTDTKFCRTLITNIVSNVNVDNLVHIGSNAANHIVCMNLDPHDPPGDYLIVDDRNNVSIAGTEGFVPFYNTSKFYNLGPGHRTNYDLYFQDNVAASQTAVLLARADHATPPAFQPNQIIMDSQGSVVEIWVRLSAARSAGTLTLTLHKNGVAQAMTVVIDGSNTTNNYTFAIQGTYNFVRYDLLALYITTDGSWAPTTADLRAGIVVEA